MISTVHVSKTTSTTAHAPELQPIGRMIAQEQPPSRSNPASPAKQRSAACLTWCRAPLRIAWHTQRSRTGCASEYAWRAPVNRWCSPAPTCSRPTDCTSARLQPSSSCALQCGAQPGIPGGTPPALWSTATRALRGLRGWGRSARARRSRWALAE